MRRIEIGHNVVEPGLCLQEAAHRAKKWRRARILSMQMRCTKSIFNVSCVLGFMLTTFSFNQDHSSEVNVLVLSLRMGYRGSCLGNRGAGVQNPGHWLWMSAVRTALVASQERNWSPERFIFWWEN